MNRQHMTVTNEKSCLIKIEYLMISYIQSIQALKSINNTIEMTLDIEDGF